MQTQFGQARETDSIHFKPLVNLSSASQGRPTFACGIWGESWIPRQQDVVWFTHSLFRSLGRVLWMALSFSSLHLLPTLLDCWFLSCPVLSVESNFQNSRKVTLLTGFPRSQNLLAVSEGNHVPLTWKCVCPCQSPHETSLHHGSQSWVQLGQRTQQEARLASRPAAFQGSSRPIPRHFSRPRWSLLLLFSESTSSTRGEKSGGYFGLTPVDIW